jgi:sugar fermentation stimulation protein A
MSIIHSRAISAHIVQGGTYIAVFRLSQHRRLCVGRLGCLEFRPGLYLYAGSAKRNLAARIEPHGRRDKPLHWHIDYLSIHAQMLGAMLIPAGRVPECELAATLVRRYELVVPGFGSSDCECGGHLFYTPEL